MRSVILSGDWHIKTEEDAVRINKILPKSVPLILMGDMIDSGLDRGMSWDQDCVNLQVEYFQEIIAKRRVLGYVLGNHEMRIMRKTGLNPYRSFMGEPQTDYFFTQPTKEMGGRSGEVKRVTVEHGTRTVQNPLAQLITLAEINLNADIVALGHDHTLGFFRYGNQWLVRTGHLQPYPEYARKMILKPKPMGYIRYSVTKDTMEVILV
jgi:predicted phosphodiesterase